MKILLARHGNTFNKGDKVFWVGARTDMPLVAEGHRQASAIAEAIKRAGISIGSIYAGPLLRTRETAYDVAENIGLDTSSAVNVMQELRELDYGVWEGRSNDEIRAAYGSDDIDNWQHRSVWPEGYGWKPGEQMVRDQWKTLVERICRAGNDGDTALIVSSNGIFRIIAKDIGVAVADAKMGTGCLSQIEMFDGRVKVDFWNVDPKTMS